MDRPGELHLRETPVLRDYQEYVAQMVKVRGFEDENIEKVFMLFTEEVGELAKAIRKLEGVKTDRQSRHHKAEEEVADVFIYLLDLCNFLQIDLEHAFRMKEEQNKLRTWE